MEWISIEKKWNEMALRLQSAKDDGSPVEARRHGVEGPLVPSQPEQRSQIGDTSSKDGGAPFMRELA